MAIEDNEIIARVGASIRSSIDFGDFDEEKATPEELINLYITLKRWEAPDKYRNIEGGIENAETVFSIAHRLLQNPRLIFPNRQNEFTESQVQNTKALMQKELGNIANELIEQHQFFDSLPDPLKKDLLTEQIVNALNIPEQISNYAKNEGLLGKKDEYTALNTMLLHYITQNCTDDTIESYAESAKGYAKEQGFKTNIYNSDLNALFQITEDPSILNNLKNINGINKISLSPGFVDTINQLNFNDKDTKRMIQNKISKKFDNFIKNSHNDIQINLNRKALDYKDAIDESSRNSDVFKHAGGMITVSIAILALTIGIGMVSLGIGYAIGFTILAYGFLSKWRSKRNPAANGKKLKKPLISAFTSKEPSEHPQEKPSAEIKKKQAIELVTKKTSQQEAKTKKQVDATPKSPSM